MGSIARVKVFHTHLEDGWQIKNINIYAQLRWGRSNNYKKIREGIIIIGNESKGIILPF
ncbi:MAG: hypothetical protein IPO68_15720 [Chitinophagaceae bacterium]|nr:hypothetical protein [Chitinophagaceae bacterium]